eukprot:CAMPEP_0176294124 /NCGR_PEP_ID=MMETSP0121_2-20121125/56975_1 /TAXON_ID=160619 /ORGANISM="Kryptoperidinium foliaceum, Strain CCMP 1326" /LENGTH=43 /DNA_ID= /DNA_START= /DNA_END= /DNA_ORIENTATION=
MGGKICRRCVAEGIGGCNALGRAPAGGESDGRADKNKCALGAR